MHTSSRRENGLENACANRPEPMIIVVEDR
jgi:hypothetical protein